LVPEAATSSVRLIVLCTMENKVRSDRFVSEVVCPSHHAQKWVSNKPV